VRPVAAPLDQRQVMGPAVPSTAGRRSGEQRLKPVLVA